jgi:hypothetical protein
MAQPDSECVVCLFGNARRGRWPRESLDKQIICVLIFSGILPWQSDLCWYWSPPLGEHHYRFHRPERTDTTQAVKDVEASRSVLFDIFDRIENFFRRLETYTATPATAAMIDVIGKIMVEVLSILAIATKEIKQGRTSEFTSTMHGC